MTYVISDLHGYKLEKLKMLLAKANFSDNDFLYILGDVVDRNGDGGVEILEWLLSQPNAQLILGNHEAMLLSCEFLFDEITNESVAAFDTDKIEILSNYQLNGGDVTLKALSELNKKSPETVQDILDYLHDAPLYEAVTAGGKDYFLCHSGIDEFEKGKKISEYEPDAFIWAWPEIYDEYFDDITTVFGHTPTMNYGEEYQGKIIKTRTWIAIDMGASDGTTEPVLLRLDDMAEFRN
ncbi:metallophosphoesterase [uncultured Eubacterium sp.]|uniref:metallophosphoesterase n=1 Tax=uncultured Eubacterium sp. TaxID=165185 RepID=UPI0025853217|nr:metallophosphoesterase [uncultured Eubacterium sp.]